MKREVSCLNIKSCHDTQMRQLTSQMISLKWIEPVGTNGMFVPQILMENRLNVMLDFVAPQFQVLKREVSHLTTKSCHDTPMRQVSSLIVILCVEPVGINGMFVPQMLMEDGMKVMLDFVAPQFQVLKREVGCLNIKSCHNPK